MAHVLIIDDDPAIRKTVSALLTPLHSYVLAKDAAEGIERAENERFDVVLVDMNMPGLDGLEALKALRHIDSPVPIIAMTGGSQEHSPEEYRVLALRMGAQAFLSKPFTRDMLLSGIHDVVSAWVA